MEKRIVIVGGGFGGLNLARSLCHTNYKIFLVDRRNHHLFQPLLYQVATAALSPADIAVPLRHIFAGCQNIEVILDEVLDVDSLGNRVQLQGGGTISYDYLILATGSTHSYFGHGEWETDAPGLKSIEDATELRKRILLCFERAENHFSTMKRKDPISFVIVGGGPTGVELAGAISELAHQTLKNEYKNFNTEKSNIYLLEGGDRLLPAFHPQLGNNAQTTLEAMGVQVQLNAFVVGVTRNEVILKSGVRIKSDSSFWAAGVQASPVAKWLKTSADSWGRVPVDSFCRSKTAQNIFVIGDAAHFDDNGRVLPGVATVAIQQGQYVARLLKRKARGKEISAFRYLDKGSLATIGRNKAVADFGKLRFSGFPAWILWAFVHILYLVGFRNRVFVFFSWAWSYLSYQRGARLITHADPQEINPPSK